MSILNGHSSKRIAFACISAIILLVLACGGGGSLEEVELSLASSVPRDAQNPSFVDLETMRGDADLNSFASSLEGILDESFVELGLSGSDLTGVITFLINGERALMVQGSIDEEELRRSMSEAGFLEEEVRGIQVWSGLGSIGSVAFMRPGRIVLSGDFRPIDIIISQLEDKEELRSNENIAPVLEELPGGIAVSVTNDCIFITEGCRAMGISLNKRDATISDFTFVALFDSEADVSNARSELEALFELTVDLYSDVTTQVIGDRFIAEGGVRTTEILRGLAAEFDLTQ